MPGRASDGSLSRLFFLFFAAVAAAPLAAPSEVAAQAGGGACGDVTIDGAVTGADVDLFRAFLADLPGGVLSLDAQERCNTIGYARPCDLRDLVVLWRSVGGALPGISQVCAAAAEPTPGEPNPDPALGGFPTPPAPGAFAVGAIDASFDVNSSGQATYTIPLQVPPGIQGVEPRLALAYNSQAGYGAGGIGFELTGLSNIERCPRTIAQDGSPRAVRVDALDRFCLDGLRLVAVTGTYGEPGTLYYTEGQTWTRVESEGACSGQVSLSDTGGGPFVTMQGPCAFDVTLKNGTRLEYGGPTDNGCNEIPGNPDDPRISWPLTAVTDTNGNYMQIHYASGGPLTCVPVRIAYTGGPGLAPPQREVRISYVDRNYSAPRYFSGLERTLELRISQITTHLLGSQYPGGEILVRSYTPTYEASPDSLRDRMSQILECNGDGVCLPPTVFTWRAAGNWLGDVHDVALPGFVPGSYPTISGDFDGDGVVDFVQITSIQPLSATATQYLSRNTPAYYNPQPWTALAIAPSIDPRDFHAGDVNGDGFTDLIRLAKPLETGGAGWFVYMGSVNGLPNQPSFTGAAPGKTDPTGQGLHTLSVGDFVGDGTSDVFEVDIGGVPARLYQWNTTTNGFVPFQQFDANHSEAVPLQIAGEPIQITVGDWNGDGRVDVLTTRTMESDVLGVEHTYWRLIVGADTNVGFEHVQEGVWPVPDLRVLPGDWNGDGLTDLMLLKNPGPEPFTVPPYSGHVLMLSTGRDLRPLFTFNPVNVPVDLIGYPPFSLPWGMTDDRPGVTDEATVADFNQDGLDDVLLSRPGTPDATEVWVFRSFGDEVSLVPNTVMGVSDFILAADFFGTGRTSVLSTKYMTGEPYILHSGTTSKPDTLIAIVNGENAGIDIEYHPMTAEFLYTKGTLAVYPQRDYVDTRYLVYKVRRDDGNLTSYETRFSYLGARTDLLGRGFGGFTFVTSESEGKRLRTGYHTTFPFSGAVVVQDEWALLQSGDKLLSRKVFAWEDGSTVAGVHDIRIASETRFDYGNPSNDNITFIATRDYSYDAYSNVTRVIDDVPGTNLDLTTETVYQNDPVAWRLGYPTDAQSYHSTQSELLSQKRIAYDGAMNPTFEGSWDDLYSQYLGTTRSYDTRGRVITSTDPLGNPTVFSYDSFGLLAAVQNQLGQVSQKRLDPRFGVEVERTDANGNRIDILVDGFGRTTEIRGMNPDGVFVALQRFALTSPGFGHVAQTFVRRTWPDSTSPGWDWKEEFHDGLGRVYRTRRRGEGTAAIRTEHEYAAYADVLLRESKPFFEGNPQFWTQYEYDLKKRITRITMPGGVLQNVYDDANREVTRIDPNGQQTRFELNARDKLLRKVDPVGGEVVYAYDAVGRTTAITGPDHTTLVEYDTLGRRRLVTDTSTGTTTFAYDATGHLVSETDARGNRIERSYDALDRTTQKRFFPPAAPTPSRIVDFVYDDPVLLNSIGKLSHATASTGGGALEYQYDFAYDRYGRQAGAALQIDGRSFLWAQSFDPAGAPFEFVYPDGSVLRTTYTSGNNLNRLLLREPGDVSFTTHARFSLYDAENRPGLLVHGNSVVTCYQHDSVRGVLEELRTSRFGSGPMDPCANKGAPDETRLIANRYDWDVVNNLTGITDEVDPARSQTFVYTSRGEMAAAIGAYGTHNYFYSPGGNLTYRDGENLTYQGQQLVSGSNGTSLGYDANGNVASKAEQGATWTFTWDEEDRLTEVTRNSLTTRYEYDFEGQRLRKQDANGRITYYVSGLYELSAQGAGNDLHTKYVPGPGGILGQISRLNVQLVYLPMVQHQAWAAMYDRSHPLGFALALGHGTLAWSYHPALARAARVALPAALGLGLAGLLGWSLIRTGRRRRFGPARLVVVHASLFAFAITYGTGVGGLAMAALVPGPNGAGVPIVGTFYVHSNHLGSTAVVTDAAGAERTRFEYHPYGALYNGFGGSNGDDIARTKFTGREFDADAAIYFMGSRYYDPSIGRFLSADQSLGGDALRTTSLNRYAYALNNPATYTDPSGQEATVAFLVIAVIAIIAGALIGGTEGKILTDPENAFDNWSWNRAVVGGWVGLVTSVTTFGIGLAAAGGAALGGIPVAQIAAHSIASGVVDVTYAYVEGDREPAKLAAYFGIGLLRGVLTGAGAAAASYGGIMGRLASETATTAITSSLKGTLGGSQAFRLRVWAVTLDFNKDGDVTWGADFFYLGSQALRVTVNAAQEGGQAARDAWEWNKLATEVVDPKGSFFAEMAHTFGTKSFGEGDPLYGLFGAIAQGITQYVVNETFEGTAADQRFLDLMDRGLDYSKAGYSSLFDKAGFADFAKGKLDED